MYLFVCLPTKHLGGFKKSFKRVRAFQVEFEFRSVGFQGERKTGVPGEKPLRARKRTNNKLSPHMASRPGFELRSHWWEASTLTTAPPLIPKNKTKQQQQQQKYRSFLIFSTLIKQTLTQLPRVCCVRRY